METQVSFQPSSPVLAGSGQALRKISFHVVPFVLDIIQRYHSRHHTDGIIGPYHLARVTEACEDLGRSLERWKSPTEGADGACCLIYRAAKTPFALVYQPKQWELYEVVGVFW